MSTAAPRVFAFLLVVPAFAPCWRAQAPSAAAVAPAAQAAPAAVEAAPAALAAERARPNARDAVVEKIFELGRSDNRVDQHLDYLTHQIGPRLTSSSNLTRAGEWARARFASFGLDAHLERWGEFPVGFDRRFMRGAMVAPERVELVFTTPSWTPGTPGPVRAPAQLEPKTLEELESRRAQLAGCWLVRYGKRAAKAVQEPLDAALDALGIAGELRVSGDLVITAGNQNISWDNLPKRVRVQLRKDQHEDLVKRLQEGGAVELEFDLDQRFVRGPIDLFNVVADLKGSELPEEYVVAGGHLDSWDGAQGAQDNGTGVATTLEAARLLCAAGAKPRRTIRFMLWSGEEQGLLGSAAYVKEHKELMPKISAVLVHDAGTNYLSGLAGPKALIDDLQWATTPLFDLDAAMPFNVRENQGLSAFGASDHSSFTAAGVPGLFWAQDGTTDYNFVHHTQHDTFENANQDYQRHSAVVVAVTAYNLAQLDRLLDRTNLVREGGRGGFDSGRRLMGVQLEETTISSVNPGGMAEEVGWKEGDVILSVDGVEVDSRNAVTRELQAGGPRKVFKLKRGEAVIESVLDYTGKPSELAREKRKAEEELKKSQAGAESAPAEKPARSASPPAAAPK